MPWISTAPLVGSMRPAMILKIVLLPQPEGPIKLTKRPGGIERVTGARARKTPHGVLKVMLALSTRSFGAEDINPLSTTRCRHRHCRSPARDAPVRPPPRRHAGDARKNLGRHRGRAARSYAVSAGSTP